MNPIESLLREHSLLNLLLAAYEKHIEEAMGAGRLNVDTSKDILKVLRSYAVGSHMVKEDRHLTPKLYAVGVSRDFGPLLLLAEEHSRIHDDLTQLIDVFDDLYGGNPGLKPKYLRLALPFIDVARLHMIKEENSIYPLAKGLFTPADWDELKEAFNHADLVFGIAKTTLYESQIFSIADSYGLTLQNGKVIQKAASNNTRSGQFVVKAYSTTKTDSGRFSLTTS